MTSVIIKILFKSNEEYVFDLGSPLEFSLALFLDLNVFFLVLLVEWILVFFLAFVFTHEDSQRPTQGFDFLFRKNSGLCSAVWIGSPCYPVGPFNEAQAMIFLGVSIFVPVFQFPHRRARARLSGSHRLFSSCPRAHEQVGCGAWDFHRLDFSVRQRVAASEFWPEIHFSVGRLRRFWLPPLGFACMRLERLSGGL
jgi:hypothetical protein